MAPGQPGNPGQRFIVVWSEQGRSKRCSTGTADPKRAQKFLAEWKNSRAQAERLVTVNDVLDAYEAAAKDETSNKLWRGRVSALRPIRAHFGPLAPEAISRRYIDEYVETRLKSVGKRTVSIELAWFRAALKRALQSEQIAAMPGMIYFTRSNPEAAENKHCADVPIANALLPYLERLKALRRTAWVIEWDDLPVTSVKRSWAGLIARAKIRDLRVHDLRRSFATFAARAGASLPDVAALMNLDEETLRRHYSHGSPIGRAIVERIGDE